MKMTVKKVLEHNFWAQSIVLSGRKNVSRKKRVRVFNRQAKAAASIFVAPKLHTLFLNDDVVRNVSGLPFFGWLLTKF